MSMRKERYWLRNRELAHGAKMYVMPQLEVRISWREWCNRAPDSYCRLSNLYTKSAMANTANKHDATNHPQTLCSLQR